MRNTQFVGICLLASSMLIPPVSAQTDGEQAKRPRPDFSVFDSNGNGEAAREEVAAVITNPEIVDRFFLLDVNQDGVVSKEEYENPPKRPNQDQPQGPWTHPEVMKAALDIGMSEEQQAKFRESVGEYLTGLGDDVRRLLRSNNQSNLERKIASKRRARTKAMNEQMQAMLSPEQYPKYEVYRELLFEKMDEAQKKRGRR
ncbi:MAG: EF-hand domain-containing protein [Pseudomonadota bacterium]